MKSDKKVFVPGPGAATAQLPARARRLAKKRPGYDRRTVVYK